MQEINKRTLYWNSVIDSPFFKLFVKNYLQHSGNTNPTYKQIVQTQTELAKTRISLTMDIDLGLNQLEKQYLLLSAQGKGLKESAKLLNLSQKKITQYRHSILQKLDCKNMLSAIIVGIRSGEIKPSDLYTPRK